jgi:ubiquinone/menaquinone biosynthesis C-methylase UbiE/DNA-binding transcriptional ArsR family regulator
MEIIKRLKAISDQTRLRLFFILQRYELNVNEIVSIIGMVQSGISRHLKILMESGLLSSRRDGSFIYYFTDQNGKNRALMDLVSSELCHQEICKEDMRKAEDIIKIRKSKTKKFFQNVAGKWDVLKKEVLGDFDLTLAIKDRKDMGATIADIGCGTGELIENIQGVGETLIGIDSSPEMLEQARKRLSGYKNTNLRLGELEHLPMKNFETNTVILSMVLNYIPGPAKAIQEISRVMASGGLFIISDFEKHNRESIKELIGDSWQGFKKEEVESWLIESNFTLETIQNFSANYGLTINVFIARKNN